MSGETIPSVGAPLNSEPDPILQWIEAASSFQIPSFHIVGLPGQEVAEARERIRAAIDASGFEFPRRRIVLNLSPASIRKRGTGIDLAMALAILCLGKARERQGLGRSNRQTNKIVAWGELGLDGAVKPAGQLTRGLYAAWNEKVRIFLVSDLEYEAALLKLSLIRRSGELPGAPPAVIPAANLASAWQAIHGSTKPGVCYKPEGRAQSGDASGCTKTLPDPKDSTPSLMPLSSSLERILGVTCAGAHHVLILGPRGTGKSHALDWLTALHPPLPPAVELKRSLLAELRESQAEAQLSGSVRRIGSQCRPGALVGGATASSLRPGEFSLAHGGLLLADELPEWPRDCREALREPLERGVVTLTRANKSLELPARFLLAASGNLCPCGGWPRQFPIPEDYLNSSKTPPHCRCTRAIRQNYLSRLSGPILDRIDLMFMLASPSSSSPELSQDKDQGRLTELRSKVIRVRRMLFETIGAPTGFLGGHELESILRDKPRLHKILSQFSHNSLRARHKVMKVALTLAAWDGTDEPSEAHFAEASCYRPERLGLCD